MASGIDTYLTPPTRIMYTVGHCNERDLNVDHEVFENEYLPSPFFQEGIYRGADRYSFSFLWSQELTIEAITLPYSFRAAVC